MLNADFTIALRCLTNKLSLVGITLLISKLINLAAYISANVSTIFSAAAQETKVFSAV